MHSKNTHRIRSAADPRPQVGAAATGPPGRPSRRQARQRSLARRRRRQRRRAGLTVLTLAAVVTAAFLFLDPPWQDDGATVATDREQARPAPATTAPTKPPSSPTASASPKASLSPKASPSAKKPKVPESGPGTFTVARADLSSAAGGHRYRVEVEDGLDVDPDEAAANIKQILNHPRGWSHEGKESFHQVADKSAGLVIMIATPRTTDRICGQYGLQTGGEVNCRVGEKVMVNLKRWELGSPMFDGPATEYRGLIINHEVGHWLGRGHETCPGPGLPAPAMMQQIKGLKGCKSNAWPYSADGDYLGGPSVP